MVKIKAKYNEKIINVFAKLEFYNYTGSIKDRLAYYLINESYKNGSLKKGMPIVEATSGNTGISFAALGAYYGHPVHIFMPDWTSMERVNIMRLYGAKVYLVSKEDGGFKEAIKRADALARKIDGYRPDQFNNPFNVEMHYKITGKEIVNKLDDVEAFVSGIGTGGTLMGIAKKLKEKFKDISIVALEPDSLPIMTKGITSGSHKIEGIGDEFIPSIVDIQLIDEIIPINDKDAINMARILAKKLGLGVGISSGANFLAAILSGKSKVVTVFADDFKKYLSTELANNVNYDEKLVSNKIELLDLQYID